MHRDWLHFRFVLSVIKAFRCEPCGCYVFVKICKNRSNIAKELGFLNEYI